MHAWSRLTRGLHRLTAPYQELISIFDTICQSDSTDPPGLRLFLRTVPTVHYRSDWPMGCLTDCESQCNKSAGACFSFRTDNRNAGLQIDEPLQQCVYQATGCHPGLWPLGIATKPWLPQVRHLAQAIPCPPSRWQYMRSAANHGIAVGTLHSSVRITCHQPQVRFPSCNDADLLNLKLGSN
jgi:hypothetical protein